MDKTERVKKRIRDRDLELIIGQLLRFGVVLSSLVVLAGGIVYLIRHGQQQPAFGTFSGEPDKMKSPIPMWKAIVHGEGRPLIAFGLLLLILTPIARIIFSVAGYLMEKDYLYVCITLIVLAVILWNF
ncbi:MAG TPA: DUF1634 domain-containing protein [Puia sp.]|jgi:uncharacterized membrane protein|nr:DUF1634 domain-containing protein [Puia sp.]